MGAHTRTQTNKQRNGTIAEEEEWSHKQANKTRNGTIAEEEQKHSINKQTTQEWYQYRSREKNITSQRNE